MGNNTLKFVVEVAADQATGALNAISTAVNQAGIRMKATMLGVGDVSKAAGKEITSLGDRMRQYAREQRQEGATARFFVNEIASIVPVSGHAQVALTGLGNVLAGGLGFGAVIAGITAFVQWLRVSAEEEKKAREETEKHARALTDLSAAAALWRMREAYVAAGGDAGRIDRAVARLERESAIQDQINYQLGRQADARREIAKWTSELAALTEKKEIGMFDPTDAAHQVRAEEEIAKARREETDATRQLEEAERALRNARTAGFLQSQNAETKAVEKKAEVQAKVSERSAKQADKDARDAERRRAEEEAALNREFQRKAELEIAFIDMAEDARDAADERERQAREAKAAAYVSMGQRIGETFGAALAQGMGPLKAVGETLKEIARILIQMAIKNVMARAAEAAAGAASSQAGIPIAGPVLAAGAMAATLSMVLGLLNGIPSASGGMKVPYDTLAMIHKDEHVIPARIAQQYERNAPGRGGAMSISISGGLVDGSSIRRVVSDPRFQRAMRREQRRRG